jgi:hypothetical protein
MRLEKRIRVLEAKMSSGSVTLHFTDGTNREFHGRRNLLLDLFVAACGGADMTPAQAEQLDLIRHSVAAQEPGGARMTELIQCFLHGSVEERGIASREGPGRIG